MTPPGLASDTLIASRNGLVRLSQLEMLADARSVTAETDRGTSLAEIRLRSGHGIIGTPNCRVLICRRGLEWRKLVDIQPGDFVATKYGSSRWASRAPRFDSFTPLPPYGAQKTIRLPDAMTVPLSFFLGSYAAEGHTNTSNYTVVLTNSDFGVLHRLRSVAKQSFGIDARINEQRNRCPGLVLSSKRLVEFLDYLGCGHRASAKRIPNAILGAPVESVLAFLEGLSLDAYVTTGVNPKWAICLDSNGLLDDLQAILTNLGIIHSRISKYNPKYNKAYDEVYASGSAARALLDKVRFPEVSKAARATKFRLTFAQSTADVIPGVAGRMLYALLPYGLSGRKGAGSSIRRHFTHLIDPRSQSVSWESVRRISECTVVPDWLLAVIQQNIHFSPVRHVNSAPHSRDQGPVVPLQKNCTIVGNGIVIRSPGLPNERFNPGHLY